MRASAQALDLPELLGLILPHVPAHDLLFQQRVNKTWQAVIKRSPSLQRKFLLRADVWEVNHRCSVRDWNPFLSHLGR